MHNYGLISVNHLISISRCMLTKYQKLRIIQKMINGKHQKKIYKLANPEQNMVKLRSVCIRNLHQKV